MTEKLPFGKADLKQTSKCTYGNNCEFIMKYEDTTTFFGSGKFISLKSLKTRAEFYKKYRTRTDIQKFREDFVEVYHEYYAQEEMDFTRWIFWICFEKDFEGEGK